MFLTTSGFCVRSGGLREPVITHAFYALPKCRRLSSTLMPRSAIPVQSGEHMQVARCQFQVFNLLVQIHHIASLSKGGESPTALSYRWQLFYFRDDANIARYPDWRQQIYVSGLGSLAPCKSASSTGTRARLDRLPDSGAAVCNFVVCAPFA